MKRRAWKTFILAVGIVVITVIAGCEEEQNISNTRKSRLIAAENMRLKKDLERRDTEIERQKELLEKSLQEKNAWKQKAQQNIQKQVDKVFADIMDKYTKLRKENEGLKAQIEKLKAELDELKK